MGNGAKNGVRTEEVLGYLGQGMTLALVGLHYAGMYPLDAMPLFAALLLGGVLQGGAGILALRRGGGINALAFPAFALFWLGLASFILAPRMGLAEPTDEAALAVWYIAWALPAGTVFYANLRADAICQSASAAFTSFLLLMAGGEAYGSHVMMMLAGYIGLLGGLAAVYAGIARVVNGDAGRQVLPLWKWENIIQGGRRDA